MQAFEQRSYMTLNKLQDNYSRLQCIMNILDWLNMREQAEQLERCLVLLQSKGLMASNAVSQ